jgi:histidine triad (HIT) family protein
MSLDGAYDGDNIFAKIIRGEIPAAKVFENTEILAFMDAFPQSRGHALVISKTSRARNLLDVAPDELSRMIGAVQTLAKAMQAALKPEGIVLNQFSGAAAGQTVFHLHFHLIPRWSDAPLSRHGGGGMADPAELAQLAKLIAGELH